MSKVDVKDQFDLFMQPPPGLARAHPAEDVTSCEYIPKAGPPEYQAAQEMVHFIDYTKLNDWQKKILWPHLRMIIEDRMPYVTDPFQLKFELGYVVGTLEVEQLRSRTAAKVIAEKYGVTFQ